MQYVLQPQIMDLAEPAVVVRHNEAAVTEQRGVGHDMTQFTFEYELGRGSSGVTYLEIHDGRMVALKVIKDGGDEQSRERTRTEVQVNNIIRNDPHCPNVVRSMECFHFGDATLITMELCCGTLLDLERRFRSQNQVICEPLRKEIMRQALRGVEFLHSHGVVHRDIKLENLFVSSFMPLEVKVGDYDRACILPSQCNTSTCLRNVLTNLSTPQTATRSVSGCASSSCAEGSGSDSTGKSSKIVRYSVRNTMRSQVGCTPWMAECHRTASASCSTQ
eukprot:TRINITY_DN3303_c0_g2_i2.p1 TRINITY_DN3303_c0_g2~~TRINITY_DN3303_c0_g2_i2.p1  ORF type:complete len:276 (+),score=22.72 TRINITY_DN3303_c0_g2_i2:176-1003(+)